MRAGDNGTEKTEINPPNPVPNASLMRKKAVSGLGSFLD
jgi:hypothetical protein